MALPNPRPGIREEGEARPAALDHKERARARMAEIRVMMGDDINATDAYEDKFFAQAPEGWVYRWANWTIFNKEDQRGFAEVQRNGWAPVDASRHRDLLYPDYEGDKIIVDGMILVERPKELNDRRIAAERKRSNMWIQQKENDLVAQSLSGTSRQHPELANRISSSVGPGTIED